VAEQSGNWPHHDATGATYWSDVADSMDSSTQRPEVAGFNWGRKQRQGG